MKYKNILFLLADDQRFNTIHALGNEAIHTPNLDRLVHMGTSFTQAHIPSGTSGAVCMPSRAMIHSGRTLFHLQSNGANIPHEHITLGETLLEAGYYSCGIGKWHNGPTSYARSFSDGDNIFFGGMWDHWNVPISHFDYTGSYNNLKKQIRNDGFSKNVSHVHCDEIPAGVHSTELFSSKALEKLQERPKDQPFFMYVSYLAPHDPRSMPEAFQNMYQAEEMTLPKSFVTEHPFEIGVENIRDEKLGPYPRQEQDIKQHIADYYAMITHLDYHVGTILDYLEAEGILEDTLIIYAGDNGLAVGGHGYLGKQSHYDHSLRIPLIMAGAGIPKDKRIDSYVYLMDIYPTLCDWMGIPIPESVEGKSMVPLITGDKACTRDSLYFAYEDLIRSVKQDGYKLIKYKRAPEHTQLFDLTKDPDELHNLYGGVGYEEKQQQLGDLMATYKASWEDTDHPFTHSFWQE
ncbi:MAG: sulfatase-like hydrolase/transferase [Cellulosilyticaceae bacterium]